MSVSSSYFQVATARIKAAKKDQSRLIKAAIQMLSLNL